MAGAEPESFVTGGGEGGGGVKIEIFQLQALRYHSPIFHSTNQEWTEFAYKTTSLNKKNSLVKYQTVHTNSFWMAEFTENKCRI